MEAQTTWCVSIRGQNKLKHVAEDREKNLILLSAAELNTPGFFRINFDKTDTSMRRTVFVSDASGNSLRNWEEVKRSCSLRTEELKKLMNKTAELAFFYTDIPRDINQAMLVKVRPIHICTVKQTGK